MTRTHRDWSSDQVYLFPPSPQDWLPEGDLVYFLRDTVATPGLSPLFAHYARELRGQPPFRPRMMVAPLLYCYATGTRSSRKIMRRWTSPRMADTGLTVIRLPDNSYSRLASAPPVGQADCSRSTRGLGPRMFRTISHSKRCNT